MPEHEKFMMAVACQLHILGSDLRLRRNKPNQDQMSPVNCLVDLLLTITHLNFEQQLSSHYACGHCKGEPESNAAHKAEIITE